MPLAFVGIWATGFIVARFAAPHAEPLTFLTMRYVLSALVFTLIGLAAGASWRRTARGGRDASDRVCHACALQRPGASANR